MNDLATPLNVKVSLAPMGRVASANGASVDTVGYEGATAIIANKGLSSAAYVGLHDPRFAGRNHFTSRSL